jgi:hypothetical protein
MIITDLNHLETVSVDTEVQGGTSYYPYSYFQRDYVNLDIDARAYVRNNSAEAFADSLAVGNNSFTKTFTNTYVTGNSSQSNSGSFAAVE